MAFKKSAPSKLIDNERQINQKLISHFAPIVTIFKKFIC